ncbi:AAA family ATPase [Acinetobacter qingfengensis]|uniref:AAA family ATPase n=1 Tax=Acinetobacter qingfengensis TaxID=1262585 RepID=UPI0038733709
MWNKKQQSYDHDEYSLLAKQVEQLSPGLQDYLQALNQIVLDKPEQIKLAVCCLLAKGHVLFEDLPGLGKTTLAQALSVLSGLHFQRIQFTNDLLPSDIIGSNIFYPDTSKFEFKQGAIFSQILLADEINRSSPKTQSALLEAMEEGMVSVEGIRHVLPEPFWVIATQNPLQQSGTYPLPESQLDRFLMCLSMGYPSEQAERALLKGQVRRRILIEMQPVLNQDKILQLQNVCEQILLSDPVLDYLQALVAWTRAKVQGLSTRGLLALKRAVQAHALLEGRYYTMHEDVQAVFAPVVAHRIHLSKQEIQQALRDITF